MDATEGVVALYIREWEENYEVNKDGGVLAVGQKKRSTPMPFVRDAGNGIATDDKDGEIIQLAGPGHYFGVMGLYSACKQAARLFPVGQRGYVLNKHKEPIGHEEIAFVFHETPELIAYYIRILIKAGKLELKHCDFAKSKCGKAVTFDLVQAGQDFTAFSPSSPSSPSLLERNREPKKNVTKTETEDAHAHAHAREDRGPQADRGTTISASENSGGLNASRPEESGNRESENREAENIEDGSSETSDIAGTGRVQGAIAPCSFGKEFDGIKMENYLATVEVETVNPFFLGNDLSENTRYAREQMIDRAMIFFRKLLPHLTPHDTAGQETRSQANGDITTLERYLVELWEKGQAETIIESIKLMQKKKRDYKGSRGRLHSVMGLWTADINQQLGRPRKRHIHA